MGLYALVPRQSTGDLGSPDLWYYGVWLKVWDNYGGLLLKGRLHFGTLQTCNSSTFTDGIKFSIFTLCIYIQI